MATELQVPSLTDLEFVAYIDSSGHLPPQFEGKIGAYAIFSEDKCLQYVGYSRNILLSLRQHLVRRPSQCYWLKAQVIDRPNRTMLEAIRNHWIEQNGSQPVGNTTQRSLWEQAIEVKAAMTPEELAQYQDDQLDEVAQIKVLKQAARRIEAEILEILTTRGVQESLRFNPKLKESGLLDLK